MSKYMISRSVVNGGTKLYGPRDSQSTRNSTKKDGMIPHRDEDLYIALKVCNPLMEFVALSRVSTRSGNMVLSWRNSSMV